MSAAQTRKDLDRKVKQRSDAEKKVGEYRSRESTKRAEANKARTAAMKASSQSTAKMKVSEADRRENDAIQAGKDAATWQKKVSSYGAEEIKLREKLAREEASERETAERNRKRDDARAEKVRSAERAEYERRIAAAESSAALARGVAEGVARQLPAPKPEKLRILMLGADSAGAVEGSDGLRIGREQQRIRNAVQAASHRDLIEFDARPAATTADLLDGITRFRPHVVHFSGHSNSEILAFEDDVDAPHAGVLVRGAAFARAIAATDDPPMLIVLNSCNSSAHLDKLVDEVAPFGIGMSDTIGDSDAIVYATQFYAAMANGQSIQSSHNSGIAALELAGLEGSELPTLESGPDVDPREAILVVGPLNG
ncbi:hypothetical protein AB9M10_12695 [Rhodococcus erythropolis]